ncbi:hypothetical protein E4T56_gene11864 [Termitomyces sp. T112]|nr:hypothetical protein E4T56_gene11864 [Termitomyces sp. T112]
MATIVYDDQDSSHFTYLGLWDTLISPAFLNSSLRSTDQDGAALSISFSGTSITLFGRGNSSDSTSVTIDDQTQHGVQFNSQDLQALYQSPLLNNSIHMMNISGFLSMGFDYATVTAGDNTPLTGTNLIIDKGDPSVTSDGNWTPNNSLVTQDTISLRAYGNTTQQTSSMGASATFKFSGTAVSVYGVNMITPGSLLNVSYTLDGAASQQVYTTDLSFHGTHFKWFNKQDLDEKPVHTLVMTVTGVDPGASFSWDYITYTPSFDSIVTKPPPSSSGHRLSLGALLGLIIGTVIFALGVIALLFTLYRRRIILRNSSKRRKTSQVFPFQLHYPRSGYTPLQVHHKSATLSGESRLSPVTDDLPIAMTAISEQSGRRRASWFEQPWRRTRSGSGTASDFPPPYQLTSLDEPMVHHKPPLPSMLSHAQQRRASHQSIATSSTNETIVVDQEVQDLRDPVENSPDAWKHRKGHLWGKNR